MTRRVDQRFADVARWPGMRSEYAWLPPSGEVTVTGTDQVGVSFSGHRAALIEWQGRIRRIDIPPGGVFVTGAEPVTWVRVAETTDALEIYPDPALVADLAAESGGSGRLDLRPACATGDPVVLAIAGILRRSHVHGGTLTDIAASTLAHRLGWHVLRAYGGMRVPRPRPGTLTRRAVQRVADLIDGQLAGPLSLDELARSVSLSPYHFAHSFTATTGLPPHQFVTLLRMERAKTLLMTSRTNVAAAAEAVGYSNVSHFRRIFRRYTGWSAGDLRAR
jgi:AraC family transcriptional regulator